MTPTGPSAADLVQIYDVLVIGGGNAALCAAMTARQTGATVLMLEVAPREFRGGNSRHTRNLRYMHESANEHLTGPYPEDEFWEDLYHVTDGQTNEKLARLTIRKSNDVGVWMAKQGCMFQPAMRGTLHLARTNGFFLGGGKALVNAYYATAYKLGVNILYDAKVLDLKLQDGRFAAASFVTGNASHRVHARSVVVASGGFQANLKWLKESWGEAADNFIIRGTPYNKGRLLRVLIDQGAKPVGDPHQCHAVAIDARAPKFDGGRRTFEDRDLKYLANLCHNCRDCYYACQYAPPHAYQLNVPRAHAELRLETYRDAVWPGFLAGLMKRNGLAVALITILSITTVLLLTIVFRGPSVFSAHLGENAFYRVIPYGFMVIPISGLALYIMIALLIGLNHFWHATHGKPADFTDLRAHSRAMGDALRLKFLAGAGYGCNYPMENSFTPSCDTRPSSKTRLKASMKKVDWAVPALAYLG